MNSWQDEFGDAFARRRVLVTGSTGFIGRHLCEALVALGAEVHGVCRSAETVPFTYGYTGWAVDLADAEAVRATVARVTPQLVYHLAGRVAAGQELALVLPTLQANLVGSVHLLLAVTESPCDRTVVLGSSEELVGGSPNSPYAAAKLAASLYTDMFQHVYGIPSVMVRPFMTYGPRQGSTKLIPHTISRLLQDKPPRLTSGSRICDFVYVGDVVRGLLRAGIQPSIEGKAIELGTGVGTSIRDVVETLVELTGSRVRPEFGAVPDRIGEQPQVAAPQPTQELLAWQPVWSLRVGLMETVNWFRDQVEGPSHDAS